MHRNRAFAIAAALAATLAAGPATAQQSPPPPPRWRLDVGAATLVLPRYPGSDRSRLLPIPYVEAAYRDLVLATVRDGRARVDVTPLRHQGLYLGGEFSLLFPQPEGIARLPAGFGDIPATPDIGVVAGFATRAVVVEGRLRQALAGHGGATAQLGASLRFPVPGTLASGRPTIVSLGPQLTWGDGRYARRFLGIDPGRAERTGLPRYDPADALTYGGTLVVVQPLAPRLTLLGVGSVARLTGDAARSPIVRQPTNVSAVVALAWRFQG